MMPQRRGRDRAAGRRRANNRRVPTTSPNDTVSDALLAEIASRGGLRKYPANAIVINEGDSSDALYIVMRGRLKVYTSSDNGREIVLAEIGAGEYFGELSLDGGPRSASIASIDATECRVVQGAELRRFLADHPDFAHHLSVKLMRMVRRLTDQVRSLALENVYQRLARFLMEASDPAGAERVARHKLTQQDMAERIGSSREMVNRVLKQLADGGYVTLRDDRYVVHRKLPAGF
jgi:CRP/FNR family cyclic AMP-dependent transcriptional regulator